MSKLPVLMAVLACFLGFVVAGCGDDDDETTEIAVETGTTSTDAVSETCPDANVDLGGIEVGVTDISTDAGCESVAALAADVLSRDDCVEESPGGFNECESQGYTCTTTIPGEGGVVFAVSCDDPSGRHTEFSQTRN